MVLYGKHTQYVQSILKKLKTQHVKYESFDKYRLHVQLTSHVRIVQLVQYV